VSDDLGTTRSMFFPHPPGQRSWADDRPARVATYRDAVALPLTSPGPGPRIVGAVYDDLGQLIHDTERAKVNRAWAGNPPRDAVERVAVDRVAGRTFFGGHLRVAFGHVLLEIVPRLWPETELHAAAQVVFYATRVGARSRRPRLPPYAVDLLSALGVDPMRTLVVGDRAVRFDELTVPSPAFRLKRGFSREARTAFGRAGDALAPTGSGSSPAPRLYLSRSRLGPGPRRALNEDVIEVIAEAAGFLVVHPQEHAIDVQVRMVRGAEVIAGCDGSALHLGAFARPGTKLVAFDSRLVPNQLIINQIAQLDALHALVIDGALGGRTGDWTADLDRVREALDTALG